MFRVRNSVILIDCFSVSLSVNTCTYATAVQSFVSPHVLCLFSLVKFDCFTSKLNSARLNSRRLISFCPPPTGAAAIAVLCLPACPPALSVSINIHLSLSLSLVFFVPSFALLAYEKCVIKATPKSKQMTSFSFPFLQCSTTTIALRKFN